MHSWKPQEGNGLYPLYVCTRDNVTRDAANLHVLCIDKTNLNLHYICSYFFLTKQVKTNAIHIFLDTYTFTETFEGEKNISSHLMHL